MSGLLLLRHSPSFLCPHRIVRPIRHRSSLTSGTDVQSSCFCLCTGTTLSKTFSTCFQVPSSPEFFLTPTLKHLFLVFVEDF